MSAKEIDELGPVDYLVVEFPAGKYSFTGEMADQLAALIDRGIIRVLDVLVLHKSDDGSVEAFEVDDVENLGELRGLETHVAEILAADDVAHTSRRLWATAARPGVLVWENVWATPFASAAPPRWRAAGRDRQDPDPSDRRIDRGGRRRREPRSLTMPLRPARAGRRGVIGAPVARTAAVAGTAVVAAHGIDRRHDRRGDRRDDREDRRSRLRDRGSRG